MATVGITLVSVSNLASRGLNAVMPVVDSATNYADAITSNDGSQQSVLTVPEEPKGLYWQIAVAGGPVWLAFGPSPTAAVGATFLVPDGGMPAFRANPGDKVAVIDDES